MNPGRELDTRWKERARPECPIFDGKWIGEIPVLVRFLLIFKRTQCEPIDAKRMLIVKQLFGVTYVLGEFEL